MDIVVDGTLVTVATVVLAFLFNQIAARFGLELSQLARKLVVFAVAIGLTGYSAYKGGLPLPPSGDPMELALFLLSSGTVVFKVAQTVYDRIARDVFEA
mgnify:FL=1